MIIAIAVENGNVCPHFGHSPSFSFFEIEGGKVISEKNIQSPGHGHGILPDFIASNGAVVVIAGGMGQGAVNGCESRGIQVITGVGGAASEAAELFAKGMLVSSGSVCSHHHGEHHEHGHSCSSGKCSH